MNETSTNKRKRSDARKASKLVELIAAMVRGGVDWMDAAKILGSTRMPAVTILNAIYDTGNSHIVGWRNEGAKRRRPVFAFGPGEDAPHPGVPLRRSRRKVPLRVATMLAAIKALQDRGWYCQALARHLGVTAPRFRETMAAMREHRLIYIEEWVRFSGPKIAVWAWGPGVASMPKPKNRDLNAIARERYHRRRQAMLLGLVQGHREAA